MSYLQAYGHPPVLTTVPVDSGISSWSDASDCETLLGHRPAPYGRLSATHARQTLQNSRPSSYRNVTATGPRCIKRRITANKKERRRTESINNAFAELRGCIPQVPADTKLSKIKTLKLASSYIAYLMDLLAKDEAKSPRPFKAQLATENEHTSTTGDILETSMVKIRKPSGRTGWPQHVWALELKRENPS